MADLPIVPGRFKLVVRDERSKKQMNVVKRLLGRDDVDGVVNACDAGREGELIFAYLYEKAGLQEARPAAVAELDDQAAIQAAFGDAAPGRASAPRSRRPPARARRPTGSSGMNATRAATIRLRSSFDGAVSLGRVQTPTLAILARREEEIRAFVPEPYWVVDARFEVVEEPSGRRTRVATSMRPAPTATGCPAPRRRQPSSPPARRRPARSPSSPRPSAGRAPPLLYDLTSLQRDAIRRFGFTARRTLGAAQRLYEEHKALTYPRTNSRYITGDMVPEIKPIAGLVGPARRSIREAAAVRAGPGRAAARPRRQRRQGHRPPRDHPHQRRAPSGRQDAPNDRRLADLRPGRPALPGGVPPRGACSRTRASRRPWRRAHMFRTRGTVLLVPGWRGVYGETAEPTSAPARTRTRAQSSGCPSSTEGETSDVREIASEAQGDQAAAGATPTARCWTRWRPRASSSTTRSCARR